VPRTYIITIDEGGTYIETPEDKIIHIIGSEVIVTTDNTREVSTFCRPISARIQGYHMAGLYS
jgi:hypothetical protein